MITIHAKEAAEAAQNINREDWVNGATALIMKGNYQYDRSTHHSKEAFISLGNVMEDVMGMDSVKDLVIDWLHGAECCDRRDNLKAIVENEIGDLLSQMADDFNVGVR
ncbi:MAG TPA: hypothetical protein VIC51_11095 [Psychromonas sp.]